MKLVKLYKSPTLEIFIPDISTKVEIPIITTELQAGFPSPADDYLEEKLDLNKYLIKNKSSTFFAKVTGNSMMNSNIQDGDLLIIDKSIAPVKDSILVCAIDSEFTIKRVKQIKKDKIYLLPDNPNFPPIIVNDKNNLEVWGIVTFSIHNHL